MKIIFAKKELKKAQKIELANYNKENNPKFKTYSAYQEYLKITAEKDAAILLAETQSRQLRKEIYQAKIDSEKAALEVIDESVITDTNTVTSNDD